MKRLYKSASEVDSDCSVAEEHTNLPENRSSLVRQIRQPHIYHSKTSVDKNLALPVTLVTTGSLPCSNCSASRPNLLNEKPSFEYLSGLEGDGLSTNKPERTQEKYRTPRQASIGWVEGFDVTSPPSSLSPCRGAKLPKGLATKENCNYVHQRNSKTYTNLYPHSGLARYLNQTLNCSSESRQFINYKSNSKPTAVIVQKEQLCTKLQLSNNSFQPRYSDCGYAETSSRYNIIGYRAPEHLPARVWFMPLRSNPSHKKYPNEAFPRGPQTTQEDN